MTYTIAKDGSALTVRIIGRLDVNSSPVLDKALSPELDGITDFTIDFAQVECVTSMGLRLLLSWQKRMFKQGDMHIVNVSEGIMPLFDETGFTEIIDIQPAQSG